MPVKLFQRFGACFGRAQGKSKKAAVPKEILELKIVQDERRRSSTFNAELGIDESLSPGEAPHNMVVDTQLEKRQIGLSETSSPIVPATLNETSLNEVSVSFDVSQIEDEEHVENDKQEPQQLEEDIPAQGAEVLSINESIIEPDLSVNISTAAADASFANEMAHAPTIDSCEDEPLSACSVTSSISMLSHQSEVFSVGSTRSNSSKKLRRINSEIPSHFNSSSRSTYKRKYKHHENMLRQQEMRKLWLAEKQQKEAKRQELYEQQQRERDEEKKKDLQHWKDIERDTYAKAHKQHVDTELAYFRRLVNHSINNESLNNVTM
jgi:hypothetical protein